MRPAIGALPLLAVAIAMTLSTTSASFSASTSSPNNAFTNLVVQPAALGPPVSASGGAVQLTWAASPTAGTQPVTYGVLRSPAGLATWTQVATLSGLTYSDLPPADGSWDYEIRTAVATFTRDSSALTGLSDRTPPTAATGVAAATGSVKGTITVSWTAGTDGGSGVGGYAIQYVQATTCPAASVANYPSSVSVGAVTSTTVSGLTTGKVYCGYMITLDVAGNQSGASNVVSARAK